MYLLSLTLVLTPLCLATNPRSSLSFPTDPIPAAALPTSYPGALTAQNPAIENQIRNTLAHYPLAIDGKNFDALDRVFTQDAVANYSAPLNVLTGLDEIKKVLGQVLAPVLSQHSLGTTVRQLSIIEFFFLYSVKCLSRLDWLRILRIAAEDELSTPRMRGLSVEGSQWLTNVKCIGCRNRKGRERGQKCGLFYRESVRDRQIHWKGKLLFEPYHHPYHKSCIPVQEVPKFNIVILFSAIDEYPISVRMDK